MNDPNISNVTPEDTSNKTIQTIIIIILIIVAIIVFIFLLVFFIDIPAPLFTPFINGSLIKIRSVANNKYLVLRNCNEYPSCVLSTTDSVPSPICPNGQYPNILTIDGGPNDDKNTFAIYQYQPSDPNKINNTAIYYITLPNSNFALSNNFSNLVIGNVGGQSPSSEITNPLNCDMRKYNFGFDLIEGSQSSNNIPGTGTYQIHTAKIEAAPIPPDTTPVPCLFGSAYWYNNNQVSPNSSPLCDSGTNNNPTPNCCPLVVKLVQNPTNLTAPLEIINYSFFVEVVGKIST